MIRLIVDSTCDLPQEVMEKYGVGLLPLHVMVEGNDYRDRVEITTDEVFNAMRRGIVPKTSQVGPEDMYRLFQSMCDRGDDFIYLAFSSALSGTYQIAKVILQEFQQKYPQICMAIVDSKGGSVATGLIALQTIKYIESGCSFDQAVDYATQLVSHVEHVFTIADIGWLVKGGRISKLAGVLGSILDVRPILDVKNGLIQVIKKARGTQKALGMIVDILVERIAAFPNQIIGISHSDNLAGVEKVEKLLVEKLGPSTFIISQISSVMGSHLGIDAVGLFFFNAKPEPYFDTI